MTKSKIYSYFNYFVIEIVLLWGPLQGTILNIDGKGRTIFVLTIFSLIVNFSKKEFLNILFSKPIIFWAIWCIYVTINSIVQGSKQEIINFPYFIVNDIFCPCILMAISAYEYTKNSMVFLKIVVITFVIYAILGAFFMDIGYVALEKGVMNANTLGNALALNVMLIIFFCRITLQQRRIKINYNVVISNIYYSHSCYIGYTQGFRC